MIRPTVIAIVCSLALAAGLFFTEPAHAQNLPQGSKALWVYAPVNFQVDRSTDELIALLKRAAKAGYNGAVITDFKFGKIQDRPKRYYTNMIRTQKTADEFGIELIPAVFPIGYSTSLLQNDPNLAEGIPVIDARFIVKNGKAELADQKNLLPFGDFESMRGDKSPGWGFVDGPGKSTFRDTQTKHSGAAALRMEKFSAGNEVANCRVSKTLNVEPWKQFHLSLWIKTQDAAPVGSLKAMILAGGGALSHSNLQVKPNQDWTQHHVVFNSMHHKQVRIYIGIWAGSKGKIWLDDIILRPIAGVNMLRREGCSVKVTSADGKMIYSEGRDYKRWTDPKMGRLPYAGEYRVYNKPEPIVLTKGSHIKDGQTLLASFYHTAIIYDGQVSSCLEHPRIYELLAEQVDQLNKYFHPKTWFMNHDELRLAGQCGLCRKEGVTAGQLLAENVRRCTGIIRKRDAKARIFVWSDMFDPNHNARNNFYLVGSTLKESWLGLDKSVGVMNWNNGRRGPSLKFFADRGHQQIVAGYYDGNVKANVEAWKKSLVGIKGAAGFMYTTWRRNYRDLERFADLVKSNAP
jgi:hypothetical protein